MAPRPVVFAMANPDPEILPSEAHAARDDLIMATGRSDFPNQVNNVLGFPFYFSRSAGCTRQAGLREKNADRRREKRWPSWRVSLCRKRCSRHTTPRKWLLAGTTSCPSRSIPALIERIPQAVANASNRVTMVNRRPRYINLFRIKLPLPGVVSFLHRVRERCCLSQFPVPCHLSAYARLPTGFEK